VRSLAVGSQGEMLAIVVPPPSTTTGLVVTKADASGQTLWSRPLAGVDGALPVLSGSGTAMLAGAFEGTLDLGAGPLVAPPSPDGGTIPEMFIATLPP
jgi:hypothetical protein